MKVGVVAFSGGWLFKFLLLGTNTGRTPLPLTHQLHHQLQQPSRSMKGRSMKEWWMKEWRVMKRGMEEWRWTRWTWQRVGVNGVNGVGSEEG